MNASESWAERLNAHCRCVGLDVPGFDAAFDLRGLDTMQRDVLLTERPHLFSETMVFVSPEQVASMQATIAAIEKVMALPGWQSQVLVDAPETAQRATHARGVFMGYDFHLCAGEPRLIEVNTNAGGAYLAALLTKSQQACCAEVEPLMRTPVDIRGIEARWLDMFRTEWRLERGDAPLKHVLIVDEVPTSQFLYPEFLLFRDLFARNGIRASIAGPEELLWRDGTLWHEGAPVDLVYNRLTDFYFESAASAALRAAWLGGAVVVSPNPRAHALYADKRHLVRLSDAAFLAGIGLDAASVAQLARAVPATRAVSEGVADELWSRRRDFFFKPATGFGGRAAYRGDKLTRRVWGEILVGDYVAQTFAPPAQRRIDARGETADLKFDVRAYVYGGAVQLFVARLYSGQTTNFRTPGGGFAPVFVTPTP